MARGHIRKYKGKRKQSWQVVVSLGWDPETGKYRQKKVTVNGTKKDAERVLRELLQTVQHAHVIHVMFYLTFYASNHS